MSSEFVEQADLAALGQAAESAEPLELFQMRLAHLGAGVGDIVN